MTEGLLTLKSLCGVNLKALLNELDHELLISGEQGVDLRVLKLASLRIVEAGWKEDLVERG
jgi:hypothetical protein